MKTTNTCPWLKRGSTALCGKACVNDYCATHRQQFRLGRKVLAPCRICGIGCGSSTYLCPSHGSRLIGQKLVDTEKRARRDFTLVLIAIKNPIREWICI